MRGFRGVTILVVLASLAAAVWVGGLQFRQAEASVLPLAPARSGEFLAVIRTRGQVQARRAMPVYAPFATDLRIAWMAPASERIDEDQPMIRFDTSAAERDLIERRAAVERAQAALDRGVADAEVAAEQDRRDLIDARLGVELAQLATLDSDFVARLEAEAARIDLRVAEQNLRQLEAEVAQRKVSRESQIASLRRQLEQAQAWVDVVERRIEQMEIRAPVSGYAIYTTNNSSLAAALSGTSGQPFRVGDQVSGGMNLATMPDMSSLLIDVAVEEFDRGRMRIGDEVIVRIDAVPDLTIRTTLSGISPLAELSMETRGRSFHAQAALGAQLDSRVRPGMNGSMDIVTERILDATIVPAQALFTRAGRPTVYVLGPDGFTPVHVEVLARNPDEIAVNGLERNARVALVDPTTAAGDPEGEGAGGDGGDS